MIKPEQLEQLNEQYPLVRFFLQKDYVTSYDARCHFAVNLTYPQFAILFKILTKDRSHYFDNIRPEEFKTIAQFQHMQNKGIFCPGGFPETYTMDRNLISKIITNYSEYIVTRKFCLEITEKCNLRCNYCPYTIATQNRRHTTRKMSFQTAVYSIDKYFQRYIKQYSSLNPDKQKHLLEIAPPNLSWFGGECFLNFDLMKKSLIYFTSLPWSSHGIHLQNLSYTANSNFYKITDEMINFLIDNNVVLYVSLDGPEEQNDKYRITIGGKGTFYTVYKNLIRLHNYNNEYFKKRVVVLATACPNHDSNKCISFIEELGISYFRTDMQIPGKVVACPSDSLRNLDTEHHELITFFQEMISKNDLNNFLKLFTKSKRLENLIKLIKKTYFDINTNIPTGNVTIVPLGMRTCPMGFDELMISVDGNYHMCHKTDASLPIGNTNIGYNLEVIIDAYINFHKLLNNSNCKQCWAIRFCTLCAAPILENGSFFAPSNDECQYIRKFVNCVFQYYQVLSEYPDIFWNIREKVIKQNKENGIINIHSL